MEALKDVSLTVENGDIYGVIGFSGAGKSTLIRMANLLERPDSGSIKVDGVELTGQTEAQLIPVRRKIGMVFQQFNLLESRTVAQNIEIPMKLAGIASEQRAARVKELLQFVELSDKANTYVSRLSGGQKQRVGIARALALSPSILLCDEATSALDPQTTESILALLKAHLQQGGRHGKWPHRGAGHRAGRVRQPQTGDHPQLCAGHHPG